MSRAFEKLVLIYLGFEYTYIRKSTVALVIVKAKADNKLVGNFNTAIVGGEVYLTARGFVKQSAGANALCALLLEILTKVGEGASAVDDVLNNDDVAFLNVVTLPVENNLDSTARLCSATV